LESLVVTHGDRHRAGGTWMGSLGVDTEMIDRPVSFTDGRWSWVTGDDIVAGHVTAGGGFVRCVYDARTTPIGPSTGDLAAAFWEFAANELGTDTAGLSPARPSAAGV
jgi:hypothetical protein